MTSDKNGFGFGWSQYTLRGWTKGKRGARTQRRTRGSSGGEDSTKGEDKGDKEGNWQKQRGQTEEDMEQKENDLGDKKMRIGQND